MTRAGFCRAHIPRARPGASKNFARFGPKSTDALEKNACLEHIKRGRGCKKDGPILLPMVTLCRWAERAQYWQIWDYFAKERRSRSKCIRWMRANDVRRASIFSGFFLPAFFWGPIVIRQNSERKLRLLRCNSALRTLFKINKKGKEAKVLKLNQKKKFWCKYWRCVTNDAERIRLILWTQSIFRAQSLTLRTSHMRRKHFISEAYQIYTLLNQWLRETCDCVQFSTDKTIFHCTPHKWASSYSNSPKGSRSKSIQKCSRIWMFFSSKILHIHT